MQSILARLFDAIDYEQINRRFRGCEPQPELLLERGVDIGRRFEVRICRCAIGRPFHDEAETFVTQTGLVHHGLIEDVRLEELGKFLHRRIDYPQSPRTAAAEPWEPVRVAGLLGNFQAWF